MYPFHMIKLFRDASCKGVMFETIILIAKGITWYIYLLLLIQDKETKPTFFTVIFHLGYRPLAFKLGGRCSVRRVFRQCERDLTF